MTRGRSAREMYTVKNYSIISIRAPRPFSFVDTLFFNITGRNLYRTEIPSGISNAHDTRFSFSRDKYIIVMRRNASISSDGCAMKTAHLPSRLLHFFIARWREIY